MSRATDILGPGCDPFGPEFMVDVTHLPVWRGGGWADFVLMPLVLPVDFDPNYHRRRDGEWPEVATLAHTVEEFDGIEVPVYDLDRIDPERAAWLRERGLR